MNREQYLQKRNLHFEDTAEASIVRHQVAEDASICGADARIGPSPVDDANERGVYLFLRQHYPGASAAGR